MKKFTSFILIITIILSMFTTTLYAAEKSGMCGENLSWTFNDDGTLTISGYGPMQNTVYDGQNFISYVWIDEFYDINNIVLNKGITSIGAYSFEALSSLKSITIPDGVTTIGMGAFQGSGIKNITLPASVTKIEAGAFYYCPVKKIYYGGTVEQWNSITFGEENDNLYNAEVIIDKSTPSVQTQDNSLAANEIKVLLNGSLISFDQPPVISNGRTLVPLRAIFEALGAEVEWDADAKSIMAFRNNTAVLMTVDYSVMTVGEFGGNAQNITLDVPPAIINGRTMIPVRAVAEAFNCSVNWNSSTNTVTINDINSI